MPYEPGVLSNANARLTESYVREVFGIGRIVDHPPEYDDHKTLDHLLETGTRSVYVGDVPDPEVFSSSLPKEFFKGADISGLTIKNPGSDEYRIPREIGHLGKTIQAIMEDQFARCPLAFYKHAILFFSRSNLEAGDVQRTPNWHRDNPGASCSLTNHFGMVSRNIPAQIYIVSDRAPTMVQSEPLKNRFDMFSGHDKELPVREGVVRQLRPYEIALMNSYVWHRGMPADNAGERSFVAVAFVPIQPMENIIPRVAPPKIGPGLQF